MHRVDIIYALVFDESQQNVLMVRNDRGRGWTLPGGGHRPPETLAQAAMREVLEETGYHVQAQKLVAVSERIGTRHDFFFVFLCTLVPDAPQKSVDDEEIEEVAWVPIEEADDRTPWYPHSIMQMARRFEADYFVDILPPLAIG